ncbi:Aste57867_6985 [Aphanomyces stellatus]|nr:hypothetical protein As57867_006962 [Aphanomyces stellatus]VFT83937.1 Aste57867_6985 [Aphanomyces stellatus]
MVSSSSNNTPWSFFGWITMYEWVVGIREVYTFEGDVGTLTTISPSQPFVPLPADPLEVPLRACFYIWYIVVYMTFLLTSEGALVLLFSVRHSFRGLGSSLFYFHRVVGSV